MGVLLLTLLVGFSAVIQGGLNRQMGSTWGLPSAIVLNAVMFLIASVVYYAVAKSSLAASFPVALQELRGFENWKWWYFVPGLLGFIFVIGIPFSISKIGALQVFVGLVLAQVVGGLLWDRFVEGIDITPLRLGAAGVATLAVLMASW